MCEPVSIVAATLTIAVNAFKTGRTTYSLIQGLRDAPNHIEQLSSHLSAFNAVLASLHVVIAQEAAKVDHDPLTISQLENLPGLLNICQEVLIEARTIVEPIAQGLERHQGLRAMQWQAYRRDDLALITNKLKDYTSTLTLGCSALTIAKSNTAQETTATILDGIRDIQRKLTQVQGGLAYDEPLLRYLTDTESVISGSVPTSAVPSRQNTIGRNTGFVYELTEANVTNAGAARTPAPSRVSRSNPFRRLFSSTSKSSETRPRPPPPEDLRARVESIFSQPSEPEQLAAVSRTINRNIWNSVEPQQGEPPPPSNEAATRHNPAPLPFVDTLLSQQLAGDDQMLYEMHFRHAPEGWRDPITEFCHSQFLRLQNASPDVHEVHRKYSEYRALVKGSDRDSCVWQFLYRGWKIKYDKSPLPMVTQVTLEMCRNDPTADKPLNFEHRTYAYVFDECLVLARQEIAKRTRSCSVIGYLHYQNLKALDMPAYGIKNRYLSIRCHNGTLMADGTMLGDIRLKFNTDEDKLFVKDVMVRWAAAHTPKTTSREQVAWDKKLKALRGRYFEDPVTGNITTGEEIERYTRAVDKEHSQLTKDSISADELAQLFGELRPKYEALPTSVQQALGSGFVSQTADARPTQRSLEAGISPEAADARPTQRSLGAGIDRRAAVEEYYEVD